MWPRWWVSEMRSRVHLLRRGKGNLACVSTVSPMSMSVPLRLWGDSFPYYSVPTCSLIRNPVRWSKLSSPSTWRSPTNISFIYLKLLLTLLWFRMNNFNSIRIFYSYIFFFKEKCSLAVFLLILSCCLLELFYLSFSLSLSIIVK